MLFNIGRAPFSTNSFTFEGTSDFGKSGTDWMLALLTNGGTGKFVLKRTIALADVFLVAGGAPGANGSNASGGCEGGNGGGTLTPTPRELPPGEYTIHIGGSGENTTMTGPGGISWTAVSGEGGEGGHGASGAGIHGADGVLAWGDANTALYPGWVYGSGGGRGAFSAGGSTYNYGNGGSVGTASQETTNGRGGDNATTNGHPNGYNGLANTGQGGGGGRYKFANNTASSGNGGAGGSGIILIRPHKEVST